jgi:hypothetical protein
MRPRNPNDNGFGPDVPKNNAFGQGSPSWNLAFPAGNLTAIEMITYIPHCLKSIDVIDRFITNGGRSVTIAVIINEFRVVPEERGGVFQPNSAQKMMSYAMRRAGFENWKVGTHHKYERPNPLLKETDLNVEEFRLPLQTHPKDSTHPRGERGHATTLNREAKPVDFKTLGRNVKKHPTGSDSLDLARCVRYAISRPDETYYYPTDFELVVNLLGGPAKITDAHLDKEIFRRREQPTFPLPATFAMPRSLRTAKMSSVPASGSPLKRMMGVDDNENVQTGATRKSGRLATKERVNLREDDSADETVSTFKDVAFGPGALMRRLLQDEFEPASGYATPVKKRKLNRLPATPGTPSDDGDFHAEDSELDEEIAEAEMVSDDDSISASAGRGRAAARKARQAIRGLSTETQRNIESLTKQKNKDSPKSQSFPQLGQVLSPQLGQFLLPQQAQRLALQRAQQLPPPGAEPSPEMLSLAKAFSTDRKPAYLKPPYLSKDRLRVDSLNVHAYADDECNTLAEIWDSALSSTRFGGPRRSPPFRELHRLTDPPVEDVSDWAENIRWAKEQHKVYGSVWTEYDNHLEQITEHRRMLWVSEEAITGRARQNT